MEICKPAFHPPNVALPTSDPVFPQNKPQVEILSITSYFFQSYQTRLVKTAKYSSVNLLFYLTLYKKSSPGNIYNEASTNFKLQERKLFRITKGKSFPSSSLLRNTNFNLIYILNPI